MNSGIDYINQQPLVSGGYYNLPDPAKPKQTKRYVRATTIAKTLDDTYNLTRWAKRQVAVGVAKTPSIAAAISADHDNPKKLDVLAEQALAAAGGVESRDLGTALHRLIERHDLDQLDGYQGEWADHIRCYTDTLKRHQLTVEPAWCETILVNDTYGIAGTVDRLLLDHDSRLVVADLKTGGYCSWLAWAIQFAIYATATHYYDRDTRTVDPVADGMIRQDHSIAVHLPAAATPPVCELIPLSVPLGLDGLLMALEVRRVRGLDRRNRLEATTWQPMITTTAEAVAMVEDVFPTAHQLRVRVTGRIEDLKQFDTDAALDLLRRWPSSIPKLKQSDGHTVEQLETIFKLVNLVEADHGIPF